MNYLNYEDRVNFAVLLNLTAMIDFLSSAWQVLGSFIPPKEIIISQKQARHFISRCKDSGHLIQGQVRFDFNWRLF